MNNPKKPTPKTAVLLFAQSEEVESAVKPIAYSAKRNVLLWKKLNNRVLKTIEKTKLPYFISNETNQFGVGFGDKLTHAIQNLFGKGFENVIVVGNDCVALKSTHILQATKELQTNSLILGSDYDGGAYLIGVTKKNFDANCFTNLAWQTKHVFRDLQDLYQNQSIGYLTALNEFNTQSDFKKALDALSFSDAIRNLLLSFLITCKKCFHLQVQFSPNIYHFSYLNKGSPVR